MQKWFFKIGLFLLPIFCYGIAFEWYCRNETFFSIKRKYALQHLSSFETVFMGTSHIEKGIKIPDHEYRFLNWGAPGQTYPFEYFLLKKYIPQMKSLKRVCIEMSPTRLFLKVEPDQWSANVYWIHYGIPYGVDILNPRRSFHIFQSYLFFRDIVHRAWNPWEYHVTINEAGFGVNDEKDRFWTCDYDSIKIAETFKMKYDFKLKDEWVEKNLDYLDSTIQLLHDHQVKVVFLIPPFYKTFDSAIPPRVKELFNQQILKISNRTGVKIFNFNKAQLWKLDDFYNDNHLNPKGAQKWFDLIQDSLNQTIH